MVSLEEAQAQFGDWIIEKQLGSGGFSKYF